MHEWINLVAVLGNKQLNQQCVVLQTILGQRSKDTNYRPYFQGSQCILELNEACVCLGRNKGTKCLEKCQSTVIFIRVISNIH